MRASTLLLLTFVIWLTAKGRLGKYWELATTNTVASGSDADSGSGDGFAHASLFPDFSWKKLNPLDLNNWLGIDPKATSGGGGW